MAEQLRSSSTGQTLLQTQVVRRELATPDTLTLWLAHPGTHRAPAPYLPGQFITLALPGRRGPVYRSYSLSSDGRADVPWEITVKRQSGGLASSYLFEHAQFGATLAATMPRGTFTLPRHITPGMPLIFVAAGAGIAPIYGMLRALSQLRPALRKPLAQLHYAAPQSMPLLYGRELAALAQGTEWLRQWNYSTSRGALLTPETVLRRSEPYTLSAHWYICGSEALKLSFQEALERQGVPADHIHSEIFARQEERPDAHTMPLFGKDTTVAQVRIAENGALLDVRAKETLLQALERQGYTPNYSCRTGVCGICRLRLLSGQVRHSEASGLTPDERAEGYILACTAYPTGEITLSGATTAGESSRSGRAARQGTMVALRIGMAATAAAVFAGAWALTNHKPASAASVPNISPPVNTTPGGSGISTQPLPLGPNSRSGVS